MSEQLPSFWVENVKRTWQVWKDHKAILGFVAIVITVGGYEGWLKDPQVSRYALLLGLAYAVLQFLVVTPWAMWTDAQKTIGEFQDRARPQLTLVHVPERLPWVQELQTLEESPVAGDGQIVTHRLLRVGIRNDSNAVIPRVRVVVESYEFIEGQRFSPAQITHPALLEHALNVMGFDEKNGFVDVAPGDGPTAFVDVVDQYFNPQNQNGDWMSLQYASGHRVPLLSRATYRLGLRVEGGGTYYRAKFIVRVTGTDTRVTMQKQFDPAVESA